MADPPSDRTEQFSDSALDIGRVRASGQAILRCVDTSVLRDNGGREIKLDSNEVSIGRGDDNDVSINGIGVSRTHAKLYFLNEAWHVEDLGSTNGTRVNNSNVTQAPLSDGDTVAFGRVCYKFIMLDTGRSSRTLDLGMDQTLVLQPDELPPGTDHSELPEAIARAAAARAANPGATAQRRVPVRSQPAESSNLLIWIAIVLAVLVVIVGVLAFLT